MSVNEFIDIIYNNVTTNVAEIIEDKRKVIYEILFTLEDWEKIERFKDFNCIAQNAALFFKSIVFYLLI